MPGLRQNMSISDKDLRRLLENLDNHEARLRRLETQEIGVSVSGGLVCLETQVVDGSETEITFSSIDQGFTHLWLLIHAGAVSPSIGAAMQLTFNGDSGSNYHSYSMEHIRDAVPTDAHTGIGSSTGTASAIRLGHTAGNVSLDNNNFCACEVNILNYRLAQSSATKRAVVWKGWDYSPNTVEEGDLSFIALRHGGGQWINTANAITSLTVSAGGGFAEFDDDSMFTLMGLCSI